MVSYEGAFICTGLNLETLATRRHISCAKFINMLKSEKEKYNHLACIVRKDLEPLPIAIDKNYYFRIQSINKFVTNRERFGNLICITIKYA